MRTMVASLIVGVVLVLLTTGGSTPGTGKAPAAGKAPYTEKEIGQYPPLWGELKGVCSQQQTVMLIFEDGQGNLRRVDWNPNGVSPVVQLLVRKP